jgi:hypothetical protein
MPRKPKPLKPILTLADLRIAREACLLAESRAQEEVHGARGLARRGLINQDCLKALEKAGNRDARRFDALFRKIEEVLGE